MKKKYSLKGRELFKEVNIRGKKYHGVFLKLSVIKKRPERINEKPFEKPEDHTKIGIIVPKRYGKAVERNIAKRRIRAVCRSILPLIKEGTLVIIRIEYKMKDASIDELKKELKQLLYKAGVKENESVL